MHEPPSLAAARCSFLESPRTTATLLLPLPTAPDGHPELPLLVEPVFQPGPPPVEGTPQARQAATSITTAVIEVIAGRRGMPQLDGWVDREVLALVERLRFRNAGRDLRLCSVRLQFPTPDVVEVCARLSLDGQGRAAALRICFHAGSWLATSLIIALPPTAASRAGRG